MDHTTTAALGAFAGLTIFIGLPVARLRGLPKGAQGFLNAVATGILLFLFWDIVSHATGPLGAATGAMRQGRPAQFWTLAPILAVGVGVGLLSLVYFNGRLAAHLKKRATSGSSHPLVIMIATGLGLHNFSEGLAIGQSAATGAIAFAGVLVIGFALHNITEGFGIAAPMALDAHRPSWSFLGAAGLIGGGPTFVGTILGTLITSKPVYVLFLALAAGALIYVLNELFSVGRRLNSPPAMAWGVLVGFLAAGASDLLLTYLNA
ncbi:MAG: ZIP family metal transporter [Candidatus Dormibacterales bacterium]